MINKIVGHLKVIENSGERSSQGCIIYRCLCECGNYVYVRSDNLKNNTKSCGKCELSVGRYNRKYSLNFDFFKKWSEEMAYVLGYWFADGTMDKNLKYISFSSKDKEQLEQIKKVIEGNMPLYFDKRGSYQLKISSVNVVNDIRALGGIPNKSFTNIFPCVPENYINAFIRGYFDGDGWVSFDKRNRNYPTTGCMGTKEFLEQIIFFLGESNRFFQSYPEKNTNTYEIWYSGEAAQNALEKLYGKACNLYLDRKYNSYLECMKWVRKQTHNRKELDYATI